MNQESVREVDLPVSCMDQDTVIRQAFQGTSDFPVATGSAMQKKVKKGYDTVVDTFKPLISETSRSDFKMAASVSLSDAPQFDEIGENGEFETGTFSESGEQYKIATYGKRVALTRQTIINDDLSLFNKIPLSLGSAGGRKLHHLVWGLILGNGAMSDGKTLFHAGHFNVSTAQATLEAAVADMLLKLRQQKSPKGEIMNYNPGWLIVGADQEIEAKKLITTVVANSADNVNVLANTLRGVIIEATVPAKACYLTGRSEEVDMIEVAWLNGILGHKNIETTERYAHALGKAISEAGAKFSIGGSEMVKTPPPEAPIALQVPSTNMDLQDQSAITFVGRKRSYLTLVHSVSA
jgi:hypothetical protein